MSTLDVIDKIRSGEVAASEVEALAVALIPFLPAQNAIERNSLIRQLVAQHAPADLSGNAVAGWLTLEFGRFEQGNDWKIWRALRTAPMTIDRRRLMWRIRKFDALPKRTLLLEILNHEQ